MNTIVAFVKNYFIFLLVLYLVSYLAPKEEYRKYFRVFMSALMIAVLMKPVFGFFQEDAREAFDRRLDAISGQLQENRYEEKGEDVFAWFREHEGVGTGAAEEEE